VASLGRGQRAAGMADADRSAKVDEAALETADPKDRYTPIESSL